MKIDAFESKASILRSTLNLHFKCEISGIKLSDHLIFAEGGKKVFVTALFKKTFFFDREI